MNKIQEIDRIIKKAKLWIQQNRPPQELKKEYPDDNLPPSRKGKYIVTNSGIVLPMDETAKRELEKK